MKSPVRISLIAVAPLLASCGSVYDTHQPAPSSWVATYNQPTGESAGAGTGSTTARGANDATPGGAEERLREAKQLRDDGLISEKEYQQLRKRILGSL